MSINRATLLGNIGKDPEFRNTSDGQETASFSVATNEYKKIAGETKTTVHWHKVVVKNRLVDVIKKHARKGLKVYLEGPIETRKWVDKNGVDHFATEVVLKGYDSKLEIFNNKASDLETND